MFFHLLVLFLILYVLTNHFLNRIQNLPPSPFLTLPIIGHLHLLRKPLHRSLSKISQRQGPVVLLRFGFRRVLLVSSPSAVEECFTKNDISFANRPHLLAGKHFGYNYTTLGWAPYGDHWRNIRKIAPLEILSSHRLNMLSSIRIDEVKLLTHRLFANKDDVVDLKTAFSELTLNLMMRMIAGKRYYGEEVVEVEKARTFRELITDTFKLSGASTMGDFLPVLATVGGMEKRMAELQRKKDGFIQELVEEHRKGMVSESSRSGEKNKTMIEVLLALQESEPEYYKDEIIRSLMMVCSISSN